MTKKGKVGVIGCGIIGKGWAMVFASSGYNVAIYDTNVERMEDMVESIKRDLQELENKGMLRGNLTSQQQIQLISISETLNKCIQDAIHVQECVYENLEVRKEVFKELDLLASDSVVLCSSTSSTPASTFSADLKHRSQVIVGHPVNPVYYVRLVEIIPSPWTDAAIVDRTKALMLDIGQKPVILKKEIPGFALNRLQFVVFNECWQLVQKEIISAEDVEACISEGLGPRYALIGALETCHLNADGFLDFCSRYGKTIQTLSKTINPAPVLEDEDAEKINNALCKITPLEKLVERRKWRDRGIATLTQVKKSMEENN